MKIEVDINDRAALVRLEQDLASSLESVRLLLERRSHLPQENGVASQELMLSQDSLADGFLRAFVNKAPSRFSSSDIFAESTKSNLSRGEVRGAIVRAIESKLFKLAEPGKGRRPSIYEKL